MLSIEATTRNDHDVSIQDDADAETSTPNPNTTQRNGSKVAAIDINEDKPTARLKRIADAVERSRSEYKSEDAYTERGWYDEASIEGDASRPWGITPKIDRQRLEFMAISAYYASPPQHARALSLILSALDPKARSLGGLTHELLDIGINSAIACQDEGNAVKFAQLASSLWSGQMAGIAATSSDAFHFAGMLSEAIIPLLGSTSAFGLHYPILDRLANITLLILRGIHAVPYDAGNAGCLQSFSRMVSRVKRKCSEPFLRPLFLSEQDEAAAKMYPAVTSGSNRTDEEARNGGDEDHYAEDCPSPVERLARLFRLDEAGIGALQGTIRRLEKGLRHATGPGIAGNKEERGIREL